MANKNGKMNEIPVLINEVSFETKFIPADKILLKDNLTVDDCLNRIYALETNNKALLNELTKTKESLAITTLTVKDLNNTIKSVSVIVDDLKKKIIQ